MDVPRGQLAAVRQERQLRPNLLRASLAPLLHCGKRVSEKVGAITEKPPVVGNQVNARDVAEDTEQPLQNFRSGPQFVSDGGFYLDCPPYGRANHHSLIVTEEMWQRGWRRLERTGHAPEQAEQMDVDDRVVVPRPVPVAEPGLGDP